MEHYNVRIFPTAKQDLLDLIEYLNTLSSETAQKYYDLLIAEIASCRSGVRIPRTWR